MSRSFIRTSSQYLERAAAVVSAIPITLAAWFKPTDFLVGDQHRIVTLGCSTSGICFSLSVWGDASLNAQHFDGANAEAKATAAASLNIWQHAAAVFTNNSSRSCYLNGANKGTDTTAKNAITLNRTDIGALNYSGTMYNYFTGQIAEAAIWSAALDDAEIAALAQAICPLIIRPASLLAYWPLGGCYGDNDLDRFANRYDLTPYGLPTFTDHCRVFYHSGHGMD